MRAVAIVGVGLIGGSFGLALRKAGFTGELIGISSEAALSAGIKAGAIDRSGTLEEAARSAHLIYLSQPVDRILSTIPVLAKVARRDCLITDAGSTKARIVAASMAAHLEPFLGGHPLAGKEQRGAQSADPDLFRHRPYVLTPTTTETDRTREFRFWLEKIGAKVIDMSPTEHDETVAFTSHLPQLLSSALAATLARNENGNVDQVFGQGLLDMTRLALSPPELWKSILSTNSAAVHRALDAFLITLNDLRRSIGAPELAGGFIMANEFAQKIREGST
ncbi:MAG: prephenate dehydrogenase/arogenate dehydrogenase family protein [Acidobacteriaceae bacterium]|nr:prephenate dehydrogenase/arogenate dehydrogenase family protein [Acidobacteriaceae bacterium]